MMISRKPGRKPFPLHYKSLIIVSIALSIFINSCKDTGNDEDRYLIINVNYTPAGQGIDAAHRLWAVILGSAAWGGGNEIARFSSDSNQIIVPMFNQYTGYLVFAHDVDGDGLLNNALDLSVGFNDIAPGNPLTSFVFLRIPTQVININLDSANAGPCAFP